MGHARRRRLLMAAGALSVAPRTMRAQPMGTLDRDGFRASVRALGYDQAASFYIGRGLPLHLVERYARACVILVAMRSQLADATISIRLGDWRVRTVGGGAEQIRGRSDWLAELDREGVAAAARMAFEWAQLPEDVNLNAGDSVQGMLSVPISRGRAFDLILRWQSGKDGHEASIGGIRCE